MTKARRTLRALAVTGAFIAGACQSNDAQTFAVLENADAESMAAVKAALAEATGRANVELGPGDPTQTSAISVLPPRPGPYQDRSPARPIPFDIVLRGSRCYLVRRDTGETFALEGVACKAAAG